MYVPLWAVATLIYVVFMAWVLKSASEDTSYIPGLGEMMVGGIGTIIFLLFWVIYLAAT